MAAKGVVSVYFSCLSCRRVYRASQSQRAFEKRPDVFHCSNCGAPILKWAGAYDYTHWASLSHNNSQHLPLRYLYRA